MFKVFISIIAFELGSFANACIYRWPRNLSIVWPRRSFCPWCKTQIRWIHNIPVISYLLLKGRCVACHCPISIMYPINELLVPILMFFFMSAQKFQTDLFTVGLLWFSTVLVITTQVDFEWKIVPDEASFSMIAAGLLFSFVNPTFGPELLWNEKLLMAVIGLISGGGLLLVLSLAGEKILGKEVMGLGDVKLLAGYGTLLGWRGVIAAFMLASVFASVFSLYFLISRTWKKNRYIPFAPFLNAGAAVSMFLMLKNPAYVSLDLLSQGFPLSLF